MKKLHNTGLLVDNFKASIVSEIIDDDTKKRFRHPDQYLPKRGETILDADGIEWTFQKVDVPKKDEVFFWYGWDNKCYLLMAGEKPMMDPIFMNNIFVKVIK